MGMPLFQRFMAVAGCAVLFVYSHGIYGDGVVAQPVQVVDDLGGVVTLAAPAERIISLAPHNTENLYSAGAGDRVVGVVNHSDYPPPANDLPSLGTHVQFNLEAILDLDPDLVVAWKSAKNAESLQRIEEFGIAVYYSEPRTFEDIVDNIRELAVLAGTEQNLAPEVDDILADIETLRQRYRDRQLLDVFYQVWTDPLMTLNGEHFITRALEVCRAHNLFADLPILAPRVSMEAVIEANPDAIITGMVDGMKPDMSQWQQWNAVKAVRNDHYVFVDSDVMHRHTLRMLNGINGLCEQLQGVRDDTKD